MSEEKIQKIEVGGFLFQDKELAEKARREQEGIRYMKGRTNMGKPQLVLKLYDNIIEQELCQTPIGIGYLRELQDYLTASPAIPRERIQPIPVEKIIRQEFAPKGERDGKKASGKLWVSLAGNIVLLLMVAGMFAVTLSSRLPTILDYKEKLLDEYASWEQELDQRERTVQQKERELGIEP